MPLMCVRPICSTHWVCACVCVDACAYVCVCARVPPRWPLRRWSESLKSPFARGLDGEVTEGCAALFFAVR